MTDHEGVVPRPCGCQLWSIRDMTRVFLSRAA